MKRQNYHSFTTILPDCLPKISSNTRTLTYCKWWRQREQAWAGARHEQGWHGGHRVALAGGVSKKRRGTVSSEQEGRDG
jgi:hypothetical protein